jgi:hypothetical protein
MKQIGNTPVNWRDMACFDYADHFNRQDWAWEFLRINPEYCKDYTGHDKQRIINTTQKPGLRDLTINHQTQSDLKAGEWGLLNFRRPCKNGC